MEKIYNKEFIWTERYRPRTINDIILPTELKNQITGWISGSELPNILLSSSQGGTGKSSLASALIEELGCEVLWINASEESGIDTLRSKVMDFAGTVSFDGNPKLVILDEYDGASDKAQLAIRGIIEGNSKNVRFLATCNYKEKIIPQVLDRFMKYDFDEIYKVHKKEMVTQIYNRLTFILENENISFDPKDITKVIGKMYPATRGMILFLQQNIIDGRFVLDDRILNNSTILSDIVKSLKDKDFGKTKSLISELTDPESFYTYVWKKIDSIFEKQSQPQAIMILAKYQNFSSMARDKQIPLIACLSELMITKNINFISEI
jgi:replication factor C small subunit